MDLFQSKDVEYRKALLPNLDVVEGRASKFWSPEQRDWTD